MNKDYGRVAAPAPNISTKTELERLKAQRAIPTPQYNLQPPRGVIGTDLQSEEQKRLECRLNEMKQRFDNRRRQLATDRLRAVHQGRAKMSFNAESEKLGLREGDMIPLGNRDHSR